MAKIYLVGDDPVTSANIGYLSWDGCQEIKLKYKDLPFVRQVEPGAHELFITTQSSFSRSLAASSSGGALDSFSSALNKSYNDTWHGTVTLDEDDVLFVHIEFGFKSRIHLDIFPENGFEEKVDAFFAQLSSDKRKAKKRKWITVLVIAILACLVVCGGLLPNLLGGSRSLRPATKETVPTQAQSEASETSQTSQPESSEPVEESSDTSEADTPESSADVPETPDIYQGSFYGKSVRLSATAPICEKPEDASGVITTAYDREKATALEETTDWVKVKFTRYEDHAAFEGWCRKSEVSISEEKIVASFPADVPLDFETAKTMFDYYSSIPFSLFKKLERLNYDDYYTITWDDGTVAAYAYAVYGVNSREDYLKAYGEFCAMPLLDTINYDNASETVINNGKFYFTHIYARGGNYATALELEKLSDTEYRLITTPDYPTDEGDPARDYYKIIVEDGKYKLSEHTSNHETVSVE